MSTLWSQFNDSLARRAPSPFMSADRIHAEEKFHLPWNLTEWVGSESLLRCTEREVGRLNWSNPGLKAHLRAHPDYQPRMMLTLLTYAYATSVFESDDIVQSCYADPVLRGICGTHAVPRTASIGRFRRENRGLLRWLLQQVLTWALRQHFQMGHAALPAGLTRLLYTNATERLELARHMDRAAQGA